MCGCGRGCGRVRVCVCVCVCVYLLIGGVLEPRESINKYNWPRCGRLQGHSRSQWLRCASRELHAAPSTGTENVVVYQE